MDFLVIDDDKTFRDATCILIDGEGHYAEGAATGEQGLERLKQDKFDVVLLDVNLGQESGLDLLPQILKSYPTLPVVMCTAQGNIKTAVEAMRRGAVDFLEKPFQREQFLTVLARLQRFQQMGQRIERLEREVTETKSQNVEPIFDFSTPLMRDVMEVLLRAAPTSASILIYGERHWEDRRARVHQHSQLNDKPFVTVSYPSLSKVLESELFGHVRGSFTGAIRDHWGKVKAAKAARSFSMKLATCRWRFSPSCSGLCRSVNTSASAKRHAPGQPASHRGDQSRPEETRFRRDVSRGPLLPAERHRRRNAPAARAPRGSDSFRRALRAAFCRAMRSHD
jgi:NtrC-family two-component system response regulator AlgB